MDPDHDQLILRYFAGERSPAVLKRLAAAIVDDAELGAELRDELALHRVLAERGRPALDAQPVLDAIATPRTTALSDLVMDRIGSVERRSLRWRWLAAAAVLLVACLGTSLFAVQHWTHAAALASLRLRPGARWPQGLVDPPAAGARLLPGTFSLASGVAEIAFDSTATVLVEGPAELELVSPLLVRLRHGRLTTSVPAAAHGFTVAASGLRVVDLGTEAGIEVAHDGRADIQVYTGAVAIAADGGRSMPGCTLPAGTAARVDAAGGIEPITFAAGRFVRSGALRPLSLALADIVGGGDGRGSADHDGVDPVSGRLQSVPAVGGTEGDGRFHAVPDQPLIDGVFIPLRSPTATVVSSSGQRYSFALSDEHGYDIIRRGGFLIHPPDGGGYPGPRSPTSLGGRDYADLGHSLIGMHANAGITLDLESAGRAHGGRRAVRFTAVVANTAPRHLAPALCAVPRAFAGRDAGEARWTELTAQQASTVNGTRLSPQDDGAFLASAPAPTDTYLITGNAAISRLTAIRLEALADPSLPAGGPGAYGNGNFVLSRLRVELVTTGGRRKLGVTGAVADFSQAGWPIDSAVAGTGPVGWGIFPETGQAHTAVFFLDPAAVPLGARVAISLAQLQSSWHHHLLGRFRLSVTDDPDPARGLAVGAGFFTVLIDGRLVQRGVVPQADQPPARLDIPLLPGQRFLTLVSTDGGYGNGYQWTTLGDPLLELE